MYNSNSTDSPIVMMLLQKFCFFTSHCRNIATKMNYPSTSKKCTFKLLNEGTVIYYDFNKNLTLHGDYCY